MATGSWRNRVLAGLKGGGQFAATRRSEPDTSMSLVTQAQAEPSLTMALTSDAQREAWQDEAAEHRRHRQETRMTRDAAEVATFKSRLRHTFPEVEAFKADCDPNSSRVQLRLRDGTVHDLDRGTDLSFYGHGNWAYLKEVSDSGEDWMSVVADRR